MIGPDLEALLEPLERFEAIRRKAVRFGDRLADLSYANPYAGVQESAKAAIRQTLDEDRLLDLQYSPFGGQTLIRRAVADALQQSHEAEFIFQDVILTPGAMGALHLALRTSGGPDQEVIIPVPCWLDYPVYVSHCGLVPVSVALQPPAFSLDAGAVAAAVSERTCAVLLSHPANPTGRSYGPAELEALADVIAEAEARFGTAITLIADETHRDFTAPGEYQTALGFVARTIVVYSFGKYHFMQGQRLGYAAVSPKHPTRRQTAAELVRWVRITGLNTPTALMQRAVPRLLALRHDHEWLFLWRRRFLDELAHAGFEAAEPSATLFLYVRTPPGDGDFEFVGRLASQGVLVLPAPVFHHTGYFRLSMTGTERMLERALSALVGQATA